MSNSRMSLALQQVLRSKGIRPSAHRLAVAEYVLDTTDHPSAEQVLGERFARGDIDEDEDRKRLQVLRGGRG